MKEHRWPRRVYELDREVGKNCWVSDVKHVTENLHLPGPDANVLYDLDNVQSACHKISMDQWWEEVEKKSKLHTYVQVRSRDVRNTVVKSNIKRYHRSILNKLLCVILPLEIELGRFLNVKVEERTCKVCNLERIEDECHFLFFCAQLQLE